MLKFQLWLTKALLEHLKPDGQIRVEPNIALVKDLLEEDVDGHVIYSMKKLLELLNLIGKININRLLACMSSQLK